MSDLVNGSIIVSGVGTWKAAFATNPTTDSFAALNETATKPSGVGVIDVRAKGDGTNNVGGKVPTLIRVIPFGTDAANETFDLKLTGWSYAHVGAVWIPSELLTVSCTLGASQRADSTNFFADTVAASSGFTSDAKVVSPADDRRAWFMVDITGSVLVQFQIDVGTAASGNALYHWL